MFEHLDDTAVALAPPVAQVRHRARQIVAQRRRNRVAVGSAALAVSGVAGISVLTQRTPAGVLSPAAPGDKGPAVESPVEKPAIVDAPVDRKTPEANAVDPAGGPEKPPVEAELVEENGPPASAAFVAECLAAHEAASPTYVPTGFTAASPQPVRGGSVNVPARGYENADNTSSFNVLVSCDEGGITPEQLTLSGSEADNVTVEAVAIGDHSATLAKANDGLFARASWLIDDQIMVEVISKGAGAPHHVRITDDELLKVARSVGPPASAATARAGS